MTLHLPRKGRLVRALACDRKVRVLVAVVDGPARETARRHELRGGAAILAAEGLVAATLLSSQVKGDERISVEVKSEKPRFSFSVDMWGEGPLRARLSPSDLPPVPRFSGLFGAVRSLHGRELYRGVAEVRDEGFEGALSRFLIDSQQVDGRVRIHASCGDDGVLDFASGLLVERFPDTDPEEFAALFDEPLQGDFRALMTGFAFGQLAGQDVEVLDARNLEFRCTCSADRVSGMLKGLGREELVSMLAEDGGAEVTCHFCNERYQLDGAHLAGLIDGLPGPVAGEA